MNGNEAIEDEKKDKLPQNLVYMWGYLPGALPEKAPILSPVPVRLSELVLAGDSWKDVCGGGCGFAMAISENGKLITWGSADDESQSYLTSGKHGETPEPFPVPAEASVVKAAAGWAHCVSVTEKDEVYAWGWKECVPSGKIVGDFLIGRSLQKDAAGKQSSSGTEQGSPQGSNTSSGSDSQLDNKKVGEETVKRRKISPARLESDSPSSGDEFFTISPSLVTFGHGVKITTVAAGGRHTLALSVFRCGTGLGLGLWR